MVAFHNDRHAFIRRLTRFQDSCPTNNLKIAFKYALSGVLNAFYNETLNFEYDFYLSPFLIQHYENERVFGIQEICDRVPYTKRTLCGFVEAELMRLLTENVNINDRDAPDYECLYSRVMYYFSRFIELEKKTSKELREIAFTLSHQFFDSVKRNFHERELKLFVTKIPKTTLKKTGPKMRVIPGILNVESLLK